MKLILGQGDNAEKTLVLCEVLSNLKCLSEFVTLRFEPERLYIQVLSTDHCSIFDMSLPKEWFDSYELDPDDARYLTLSTEISHKIIHTRQSSQYVEMSYTGNPDKLSISFKNEKANKKADQFPKEFEMPLMDVDNDLLDVPEVDYSVEFGIKTKVFQVINDQLALFSDVMNVYCDEENICFTANGNDGVMKVNLFDDDVDYVTEFSIEEELKLSLDYSSKHFSHFCQFSKLSKNLNLGFSAEFPMQFAFDFPDQENMFVRMYLAPRMEEDTK